jgi:hypothetical protein
MAARVRPAPPSNCEELKVLPVRARAVSTNQSRQSAQPNRDGQSFESDTRCEGAWGGVPTSPSNPTTASRVYPGRARARRGRGGRAPSDPGYRGHRPRTQVLGATEPRRSETNPLDHGSVPLSRQFLDQAACRRQALLRALERQKLFPHLAHHLRRGLLDEGWILEALLQALDVTQELGPSALDSRSFLLRIDQPDQAIKTSASPATATTDPLGRGAPEGSKLGSPRVRTRKRMVPRCSVMAAASAGSAKRRVSGTSAPGWISCSARMLRAEPITLERASNTRSASSSGRPSASVGKAQARVKVGVRQAAAPAARALR